MITAAGVVRDTRLPRDRTGRSGGRVRAVDGLNLEISPGELLGIVGPEGAGKSTTGLLLTGRVAPDAGTVTFQGTDLKDVGRRERAGVLGQLQVVGPGGDQVGNRQVVAEVLSAAIAAGAARATSQAAQEPAELLAAVGLEAELGERRFGKLSDEHRARVALARVVALNPALVVLDQSNGSMSMDERRWTLEVLLRLRDDIGSALVVLASEVADVTACDSIMVMYLGRVVEVLAADDVPGEALHPYAHALLAVGSGLPDSQQPTLKGRPLAPGERPSGCGFRTRCFRAQDLCAEQAPQLTRPLGSTHPVACHFPHRLGQGSAGPTDRRAPEPGPDRPEPTAQEFAEG